MFSTTILFNKTFIKLPIASSCHFYRTVNMHNYNIYLTMKIGLENLTQLSIQTTPWNIHELTIHF
jgi:hypothetical protein